MHGHNHSHGLKDHPADSARHYKIITENLNRWKHAAEAVYIKTDKKTADSWYISQILGLMGFYAIARPSIKDRSKICMCVLKVSGFMPKLWLKMAVSFTKTQLRKITPLRKLYRFFKYRLKGKPYPES